MIVSRGVSLVSVAAGMIVLGALAPQTAQAYHRSCGYYPAYAYYPAPRVYYVQPYVPRPYPVYREYYYAPAPTYYYYSYPRRSFDVSFDFSWRGDRHHHRERHHHGRH